MIDPFDIIPFRYLKTAERARLRPLLEERHAAQGERILVQGDLDDDAMYLMVEGWAERVEERWGKRRVIGGIEAGSYFGERRALFETPRGADVLAVTDCRLWRLPGHVLRELVAEVPAFSASLARLLRDRQGLFAVFERFLAEVEHGANEGYLVMRKLVRRYRPLRPALHRKVNSQEIDWDALSYALGRLPDDIHRTLVLFLTDTAPLSVPEPGALYAPVNSRARRRSVYEMMPGKQMVMLRDGRSDLIDFITCLCAYAVEARKLRRRVQVPVVLTSLHESLPFSEEEQRQLERLWPGRVAEVLTDLTAHHEDFSIEISQRFDSMSTQHDEQWTEQIGAATAALMGVGPEDLPADLPVHIVSSNTHSVHNCLSPWLSHHADEVLAWGQEHLPELCAKHWHEPGDLVIALTRPYFAAHPERKAERRVEDEHGGVRVLRETAYTGIEVQLYDLARLPRCPTEVKARGLLVNIDYAFGEQAEAILARLISLFGRNIRSIDVLGKAGGLCGERGDVMVASRFVEQRSDGLLPVAVPEGLAEALQARLPARVVRRGPILTVIGTLLQNPVMLQTYRHLHQCVGLEMEGTWYARQIFQAQQLGLLSADVATSFCYYISDLPLRHDATLAGAMSQYEGIPPLYAITRELLSRL
jgi:CRP-like cAMP-binding protein